MMTERNNEGIRDGEEEKICTTIIKPEKYEWYKKIIYYLCNMSFLPHLTNKKIRSLILKASKLCLTQDGLRWMSPDGMVLRCVNKEKSEKLLK